MLDQEKELPNDSGRPLSYNNIITHKKAKCLLLKKQCFLHFLYWIESSPTIILMPGVYSTRKRDHRGRDGNLSQIFTTFYDFGDGK